MADDHPPWSLCLVFGETVHFFPDAQTALDAVAVHDGEAADVCRWRRSMRCALIVKHGEEVPEDATDMMLLMALLRREIVRGHWKQ